MRKRSLFSVAAFLLTGSLVAVAENQVPITSLTKNCKPLINKNLKIEKVAIRGLSERNHKRISRALEKLAEEKYAEAIELLKNLLESAKEEHVKATVAKYIGIAYAQNSDTKNATKYFTVSLDKGKGFLQHKELQDLTQNVASMHYSNDNKKESLKFLERWMNNSKKDSSQVYLLYSAILFDSGRLREAVCPAYWAAKVAKKPQKNAFGILLNAHFEFKDFPGTIAVLKQVILDFPKEKRYWRNLASVYMSQDMVTDALAVMEMFYVQGMMETANDYKQLSSIFAYSDIPYRTATILKEGIEKGVVKDNEKNWTNVAANFHVASETQKAIDAYTKSANQTASGKNDMKRGELLADSDQFSKAISAFNKALEKGSLKDEGKAHFRKGLAYLGMKKYDRAVSSLNKASKYKKWRKRSVQWSSYARTQKKNAAKLARI